MQTSQYFRLVVASLVVGGVMLEAHPAQSAIFRLEMFNPQLSVPLVGYRYVFAGSAGSPLNILSFTSEEFPITQIENNNTPLVSASIVGNTLPPGTPLSYDLEIEDNPDGTAVLQIVENVLIVVTADGLEEVALPTFTISSAASAEANTPFSAFDYTAIAEIDGAALEGSFIYQLPGDQLSFTDTSFSIPVTYSISSQPIPGYVPFEELNDFPPPTEFVLLPGEDLTFTNPQQPPSTPEPSVVVSLSALSLIAFLKKKLQKNPRNFFSKP